MEDRSFNARVTDAIHAAIPLTRPCFSKHLQCGLAVVLGSASAELIQHYRAIGELALHQHILQHFLRSQVPAKYRRAITTRILSSDTLSLLIRPPKSKSKDALQNTVLLAGVASTDVVFIFVGVMTVALGGSAAWFNAALVPVIDAATSACTSQLESVPCFIVCSQLTSVCRGHSKKRSCDDGEEPVAKRSRHGPDKRKLDSCLRGSTLPVCAPLYLIALIAAEVLTAMASAPASQHASERVANNDAMEESEVLTNLYRTFFVQNLTTTPPVRRYAPFSE
ncbi:hypothetical protein B0H19DRAFT_210505 [Mycena capillaripes]|nr:hypothetical protein B0H19DRAFT_210505 [Mycena capillaripes]